MYWYVHCPRCMKAFKIDENGSFAPDSENWLIDEKFCANCRRDVSVTIKRAVEEIIPEMQRFKDSERLDTDH